ncbi:MAG TPA: extracellular solute-binding protein [Steroidobacteraceae bacterium]|jgi:microcin C transport system substrate-binding protein|nr:extracellular solute-binding protein [Steroidobacteraceae bacterium]
MIKFARKARAMMLAAVLLGFTAGAAQAAQVLGAWTYAFAEYGDIKYPENFAHYDFVNPNAPKGGTLRLSNPDRRTSFDKYNPFTLPENAPAGVEMFMFETLADASPDEPATMYGLLASQMLIAPDYSSVSFRINPLAHFNNGDPVTAADVKYSFDMAVGLTTTPDYSQNFGGIRAAVIVDPHTVRFDLKTPSRDQIYQLGTVLYIFSRKWGQGPDGKTKPFDQIVNDVPITTGPYLIARGTGQLLDLVRDPHYWAGNIGVRKGFYNFDHLLYHYYSDPAAEFEGFKAGDFELKEELSAKRYVRQYVGKKFRDGEIIKRRLLTQMGFFYEGFLLNSRRPEFSDWRVRSALNYALDWNWNSIQGYGLGERFDGLFQRTPFAATGVPSPGELALLAPYRKDLLPQVFDAPEPNPVTDTPAQLRADLLHARKLLAAAGWTIHPDGLLRNAKGEAFQMEILEDNTQFENAFGRWAESLKNLGITTRIRLVDFAVYEKRLDDFDFDCTLMNFGDMKMPALSVLKDAFGSAAARTRGSSNYMGIAIPAVDHLIDVMNQAASLEDLVNGSRALDRIFIAEHFAVPFLYRPYRMVAYWDRFGIPAVMPKYFSIDYFQMQDGLGGMPWPIATWWTKK